MKPKVIFFAVITSLFSLLSPCKELKALKVNSNTLSEKCTNQEHLFAGELKFERVFKSGKWWIYVYDGIELVDIYPE